MRTLTAVVLSTTLLASTALAGEAGPLAPGKPAGVKQAQMGNTAWVLLGVGAVAANSSPHPIEWENREFISENIAKRTTYL